MIAATIGFVICCIIGFWILLICLGMFTWPGTGRGEQVTAIVIAIAVILFLKWINPFTLAVTVTV